MIAIDTNILLRYVLADDDRQSRAAWRLIDDSCTPDRPALVHEAVVVELVWVLRRRGGPRRDIARTLRDLLDNSHLRFRDWDALAAAIDAYQDGPADFPEYFIAASARAAGAGTTYTFDRNAARSPMLTLLPD